jgi:Kdo2-lipid IVA lauroyltransferase/acyltransferase
MMRDLAMHARSAARILPATQTNRYRNPLSQTRGNSMTSRTRPRPESGTHEAPVATLRHRVESAILLVILALLRLLPYRARIAVGGRALRLLSLAGSSARTMQRNLRMVYPEASEAWVKATRSASADTMGRYITELFSGESFIRRAATSPVTGPGLDALHAARAEGRAIILVSGHYGNYDAWRAALRHQGIEIGAFYIPLVNPAFNPHYVKRLGAVSGPLFPRGNDGLSDLVRFLRGGGVLGMLTDFAMPIGEMVDFLGYPAPTALSAAKLARKYNALLIPIYATRQPDGLSFAIELEAPIPHGDPVTMTRAINDSLSARILADPGQWYWVLKRWGSPGKRR